MNLEILGHATARSRLWGALERDAVHHALLFEGPRGVGKRRVADLLAMAANCTDDRPVPQRPCGECPTCRQIAGGIHPDVIVLEPDMSRAARTIPVEAIREVVRQTQYHRYSARHRFVIIDPAEAMQEPAANALLKTLEEPPAGTGFLVITHNASGLLPTILSRCQRVRLGSVPAPEIEAWLAAAGHENAVAAARLALGCPGRALHLATEGLEARRDLRRQLVAMLTAPLADLYAWSAKLTSGGRQDWSERVDLLLEVVEDLLRDASIQATGARVSPMDPDAAADVAVVARMWPDGIERCARAIQDARDDLEVYVSGKTAVDALVTAIRAEL